MSAIAMVDPLRSQMQKHVKSLRGSTQILRGKDAKSAPKPKKGTSKIAMTPRVTLVFFPPKQKSDSGSCDFATMLAVSPFRQVVARALCSNLF